MFENETFNNLMERALAKAPMNIDKRQGSIVYDAIAPICAELTEMYISLENTLKQGFADTSSREYLVKRARERGLEPYPATNTIVLAELIGEIQLKGGEKFNSGDVNFIYIGEKEDEYYKLKCEDTGSIGNIDIGELLPIENIKGLISAKIVKIFVFANDEEDTEAFRKRYFESFKSQAFGGNRADYTEKLKSLNNNKQILNAGGVGGVKIYRTPTGGGTVLCVLQSSGYTKPTDNLIGLIQEEIDPINKGHGMGFGIAPIGHTVTIIGVEEEVINIDVSIELKGGYTIDDLRGYIERCIEIFFKELNKNWETEDGILIRISHLESRILNIIGVQDVLNTSLNGKSVNLKIEQNSIAKRGGINVT